MTLLRPLAATFITLQRESKMKVEPVANLILVTVQDWLNDWLSILDSIVHRVHWRLLPHAALCLAGWAWVLPFAALGWLAGVGVYAARAAWEAMRQAYRKGRVM